MNERELIKRALDALESRMCSGCDEPVCCMPKVRYSRDELRAALAAPADPESCISWRGFFLSGNNASVDEARRLIHRSDRLSGLEEEIKAEQLVRPKPAAPALVQLTDERIARLLPASIELRLS